MNKGIRIGFVASRLDSTDGVSLESKKWREILSRLDCECFCFCSETDWPDDQAYLSQEASLSHVEVRTINHELFGEKKRTEETAKRIAILKKHLKRDLYAFVEQFGINLLIVENALSLPMNIPLGLALAEFLAESQLPTIAHHHDFWWERTRYAGSPAEDYLRGAFPVALRTIHHAVINSMAGRELAFRTGVKSTLIPNVMDFAHPPPDSDGYADDLRETLGVRSGERLILQPTRIVPRKHIEKAIELVRRMDTDGVLLVTHNAGDEGDDYKLYLQDLAEIMDVRLLLSAERFDATRRLKENGDKVYSLRDAYQRADLVAYCSAIEGFGNAFLEAIYYKRPLIVSAYEIFSLNIAPKGFKVLAFQEFISRGLVQKTEQLLDRPERVAERVETNYELGRKHYSFEMLEKKLRHIIEECMESSDG
jgi:glycosyltransferase involved in cell wall biosynthesis